VIGLVLRFRRALLGRARRIGALAAPVVLVAILAAGGGSAAVAAAAVPAGPQLSVTGACLIDADGDQVLYSDNGDAELPIASTTKLMTALITLQHVHNLSEVFTQNDWTPNSEDSQIGLVPGEQMSVHDLLIALLLPSADDAAEDLAYNVGGGSIARFVAVMNADAQALGLDHTHYTTPIGLDTPGNYSSAHDLTMLARYVLETEPFFRAVVRMKSAVVRIGDQTRVVTNLNDLLDQYSWINGVKTGHTLEAGYVLVASGTQDGMTLIDAVLGTPSEAARDDAALALLDWGFANFRLRTPVRAGRVIARVTVNGTPGQTVRLIAATTDSHVFPKTARISLRVHAPAQLVGPLAAGQEVGWVTVRDGRQVQARIPLLLATAVPQIRHSAVLDSVVVVSATLSGLVLAAGAAIGLTMFWREWSRG
jgi:serine-type D-Ala-D-Ala carboxypeptidase (penicillin-binding protein 5/6)